MVQDAGTAAKCTMLTRYWYKDSHKLLWHERYVLMVHLVQSRSPRRTVLQCHALAVSMTLQALHIMEKRNTASSAHARCPYVQVDCLCPVV